MNLTELTNQLRRAEASGDHEAVARIKALATPKKPTKANPLERFPAFERLRKAQYDALCREVLRLEAESKRFQDIASRQGEALRALKADHGAELPRF